MSNLEDLINSLYEKYTKAIDKETMMEEVKEIAKALGIEVDEVKYDPTGSAYARYEVNNDKLEEVLKWVLGDRKIAKIEMVIMVGAQPKTDSLDDEMLKKAERIGLNYLGTSFNIPYLLEYFKLMDNVYLVVHVRR